LYFGSVTSFDNEFAILLRQLGTETKRCTMTAGLDKLRNLKRCKFFSKVTSWLLSIARRIFSSSTFREATTAASEPSTPFGGIGGKRRFGQSVSSDRCKVSKSLNRCWTSKFFPKSDTSITYTVNLCIITEVCSSVRTMRAVMHVGVLAVLPPPGKSASKSSLNILGGAKEGAGYTTCPKPPWKAACGG